jgi:hypothetical protein
MTTAHVWAPTLAACGLLAWRLMQIARAQAAQRSAVLDDCTALLVGPSVRDSGSDYPVLRGRYRGADFEVQPLLDHVGFRKLPSLWLLVTLREALPVPGRLDVLLRPQNIEFYADGNGMLEPPGRRIELPPDWPAHHLTRLAPSDWSPPLAALREAVGELLDASALKQLLVTPRGLRLVVRVGGVKRADYLVLRSLLPEQRRVPPELLQEALDAALRVRGALSSPTATPCTT